MNVFDEVRDRLDLDTVVRHYGYTPTRAGFIKCPFHAGDRTASLKAYPSGRGWYCFGCHRGGTVIDFVVELFGLDPLDAVKKLNTDFGLYLPLDRREPTPEERRQARRRRELHDTYELLQRWRGETINRLNECFRLARLIQRFIEKPADLDQLSDLQVYTVEREPHLEYLSDLLTFGTLDDQMEVFRMRKEVEAICNRILSDMPMRSSAA